MWQCPQCKREFKKLEQDHYCTPINSLDEYISEQSGEIQPLLQKIRETIHAAAPDALEKISWRMPTFWQGENLIHFAAFKKHIGIYPGDEAVHAFEDRLSEYKHAKGSIQFPLSKPIDYELISDLTKYRVEQATTKQKSLSSSQA